ncbi:MAG TPA: phosphoglycerate kinase [Candidatus Aciduliprofundum boonei]|uniref:Phosphoglycerate kinase n=1 Tax=Candidatus Aciduliprofundum boonei TaxID=379547 RepID=A0A7J3T9G4_9ARCH|nr:phosphoglycerate kinase [Candidatus Aciduliprofundum boonei]
MKEYFTMDDFDFEEKTILVRVDVNSPIDPVSGIILDYSRFEAHRQTLQELRNAKVVILAHQSRPGKRDFLPLRAHSMVFTKILGRRVKFVPDLFCDYALDAINKMKNGEYIMLQNTRFYSEEYCLKNNPENTHIVRELSKVADYFINDAFAVAHRKQATVVGFKRSIPMIAGRLMEKELTMLERFLKLKAKSKFAILGGAKVEDSLKVAKSFLEREIVDKILTGGVVALFFLLAEGYELGEGSEEFVKKNYENYQELVSLSKELLGKYRDKIEIPVDVVVNANGKRKGMPLENIPSPYPIYDIGLDTAIRYRNMLKNAKGIIVNGPMGVFELPEFALGTIEVFRGIVSNQSLKIAGGGHTIAALEKLGLSKYFDHISTGGGALITFLSGEEMPGVEALKESYQHFTHLK